MSPDTTAAAGDAAVLLVDDRPENLLALRAVLEPLGCRLVAVTSGEDALKALLNQEFAVVLLDVQMPGMDGFETAELIKGRERTRTVPIIFVTAISKEPHHVFKGYEAGAVDYLFKPYDPELLKSKVRVFLELHAKSREAARSAALLRAAFAYAPIGMARVDSDHRFAEVNRAFAALVSSSPEQLRDRLLESLVHPDDAAALPGTGALLEGSADGAEHEARLMASDGEAIPCLLTYSVAQPGGGLAPSLVLQVQDLRARRRAEIERDQRIREQVARTEAERTSETLRALQAITDAAMQSSTFDELVAELLNRTADALRADTARIVLSGEDGASVTHQTVGGEVVGTGQRWYSVVTGDGEPSTGSGITSSLTVPLTAGGETVGTLLVGTLFERAFTEDERNLLGLAGDRAAVAILRARALQRDRVITEELQRSLLPATLPEVRGALTAARYFPGGAGERVGGDWYDAVVQSDDRLLLIIGDVAGHGIGAASAMGQLRSALRAYALDGHAPGPLLERLNAFQIGMRVRGMTTVALVSVDLAAQRAVYACAGHLPPLLVDGDEQVRWLDGALGPPLGAVDAVSYSEREADLGQGATIVLYTDGLVELRGEVLDRGLARLRASLVNPPDGVDALCDHILEHALATDDAEDDVTLLVLRTTRNRRKGERRTQPSPETDPANPARQLAAGAWAHPVARSARVELPRSPRAAGAARRIVGETLSGFLTETELTDVNSVVSEIVNNAVVHGTGDEEGLVVIHLAASTDLLRVEICNEGAAFATPEPSAVDEAGGFGLGIVEHISSRWGLDFEHGVCVWFEIDRSAG